MKLPRGVTGEEVVKLLQRFGYEVVRQRGSHVRLQHAGPPKHNVSVPLHAPLKTGTLHSILTDVGRALSIPLDQLTGQL